MSRTRVKQITVYLNCRWKADCLRVGFDRHCRPMSDAERVYVPGLASVNRVEALLNAHLDPGKEMFDQLVQDVYLTTQRMKVVIDVRQLQGKRITEEV